MPHLLGESSVPAVVERLRPRSEQSVIWPARAPSTRALACEIGRTLRPRSNRLEVGGAHPGGNRGGIRRPGPSLRCPGRVLEFTLWAQQPLIGWAGARGGCVVLEARLIQCRETHAKPLVSQVVVEAAHSEATIPSGLWTAVARLRSWTTVESREVVRHSQLSLTPGVPENRGREQQRLQAISTAWLGVTAQDTSHGSITGQVWRQGPRTLGIQPAPGPTQTAQPRLGQAVSANGGPACRPLPDRPRQETAWPTRRWANRCARFGQTLRETQGNAVESKPAHAP